MELIAILLVVIISNLGVYFALADKIDKKEVRLRPPKQEAPNQDILAYRAKGVD